LLATLISDCRSQSNDHDSTRSQANDLDTSTAMWKLIFTSENLLHEGK
jgi:hypothetical protein